MTNLNQPFENILCINGHEGLITMCIKRPFFDNKKRALYRSIGQEERKEAVEEERKRKERKEKDERRKGKIFSNMIDLII